MSAAPTCPLDGLAHGAVLRWRRVTGLTLAEVEYEPGQRIHRQTHAHARFIFVLRGAFSEIRGGGTIVYPASTLLFRAADDPHSYAVSERGARCLVVDM